MKGGLSATTRLLTLNESPSEKEGKLRANPDHAVIVGPSMKVPPKRKGNKNGTPAH